MAHVQVQKFQFVSKKNLQLFVNECRYFNEFCTNLQLLVNECSLLTLISFTDICQAFFEKHPEYAKNDFFITGESYAEHYIPAVTSRVHQGNKDNEGLPINLKVQRVTLFCFVAIYFLCYLAYHICPRLYGGQRDNYN